MKMPTYQRRYFIFKNQDDMEELKEQQENQSKTIITGKGKKKTIFSGTSLKNKLKNE